ncbi:AcOrf-149 peptide [Autographa californica nucleopolyhedrovirus]|uniref:Uncharacterized 12.4 kDa protein in IE1-IEN intergenic region n=2 Tax=Autographa californica nuclear polyhedrosis virus TaxID=46015 RepID=Y149_NPVAC|nr:AcOrf-149 peptide [Autographa californica nucleopolyhedrovirus]P41706.1 RecName: Full=Uncharacterized 12.4 kDa protein in IE1-IEN intergenic region [Autographa californica nucleopolyhedrovirus]AKN58999.1 AcOrf-149 peptide [Autographa californica multiple nucleopolyhedrovirus]ARJ58681.1 Orf-149 protein [synthetic baculovirus AcMNPV-WIV-Syn1]UVY87261.1 Acorf149 protein [synthetic construct]AAA66779.1 AcOrf-149 peptide [Autographa californica nucleopolyhedrovirus]AGQ56851.1 hypothetical prote
MNIIINMLGFNIFIETVYKFSDHTMERYHPYQRAPWSASIFKKNYNNVKVASYVEIPYTTNNADVEITYTTNAPSRPESKARRRLDFTNMTPLPCCIDDGSFAKPLL